MKTVLSTFSIITKSPSLKNGLFSIFPNLRKVKKSTLTVSFDLFIILTFLMSDVDFNPGDVLKRSNSLELDVRI